MNTLKGKLTKQSKPDMTGNTGQSKVQGVLPPGRAIHCREQSLAEQA
jgi:hypothetical protein